MKKLVIGFVVSLLLTAGGGAQTSDLQAPVLAGGATFHLERPEIYRRGWIDLNKNGVEDMYEDPRQPIDARVDDLFRRMTRDERIGQLWQRKMTADSVTQDAALLAAGGLGSYLGAAPDAGRRNQLQRIAVEDSRLGIPLIFGFDTIHGFRTVFPIPLGLSCAWDPSLVERVDTAAAAESAAAGVDWVFAPMVDIARDPRWGRIAEGFGEDPWLDSRLAAAAVRGFQGTDFAAAGRVAACLKHYVGYGAAEGGRDYNTTEIGLSTLRNIYLPPYHAGVAAGAATLMSAFNSLDNVPASGNRFTLTDVLRGEWHFTGFVVSDWDAVEEMIHHGFAADPAQAAAFALHAGVDMEMVSDCYRTSLPGLLDSGRVSALDFDQAVRRILRVKLAKGLFDRPYTGAVTVDAAAATALAREAAARCCVLLKNDGHTLPLRSGGTVALIGPLATDQHDLLGCWAGLGRDEDVVTLRDGLAAALPGAKVLVARGCDLTGTDTGGFAEALAAARQADVVVLAVGEPAAWSGEHNSRATLGLPGVQPELLDAVVATGKPVVTVLFAGRPLAVPAVLEKSAAVLMAWDPGVQGGPGIADVLTGRTDPSGRLTVTLPASVGQLPVYYDHLATGRPLTQYKDGPTAPSRPFGFGLTYTRFEYGPTRLSAGHLKDGTITVSAAVSNVGARAGTEVAQLYLHATACSFGARPVRELKGFQRVTLQPGETQEVKFVLQSADLGSWTPDGRWVTEPGRYEAVVAPDAASGQMVGFTVDP
jgi:beta-glucosidase